eukprot:Sspe_Gene.38738::Locus_18688_Transcript_1_1_Confidence_1.000_Length_1535::g.38738::m.38738
MLSLWIKRKHDPEHSEMKVTVPRDGHIADVLQRAAGTLDFGTAIRAGALQASFDGRVLSNKEPAMGWEGRTLTISTRDGAGLVDDPYTFPPSPPRGAYPSTSISAPRHAPPPQPRSTLLQSPVTGYAQHTCAKCHQPIMGLKVVLTLPGSSHPVDLHPDCEHDYEKEHALVCGYCHDFILDRLTTLSSDMGTAYLHPQCIDSYKRLPPDQQLRGMRKGPPPFSLNEAPHAPHQAPPPSTRPAFQSWGGQAGGTQQPTYPSAVQEYHVSSGFTCVYCRMPVEGTKVSLKLPGFSHKVDLHPQCEQAYSMSHALRCDKCGQPMLDGITVLTGDFGDGTKSKQLHPSCVESFKRAQGGHQVGPPWTHPQTTGASTQWMPVEGETPASYGGGVRWGAANPTLAA